MIRKRNFFVPRSLICVVFEDKRIIDNDIIYRMQVKTGYITNVGEDRLYNECR